MTPIVRVIRNLSTNFSANLAVFRASTMPECCLPSHVTPITSNILRRRGTWPYFGGKCRRAMLRRSTQLLIGVGNRMCFRLASSFNWVPISQSVHVIMHVTLSSFVNSWPTWYKLKLYSFRTLPIHWLNSSNTFSNGSSSSSWSFSKCKNLQQKRDSSGVSVGRTKRWNSSRTVPVSSLTFNFF